MAKLQLSAQDLRQITGWPDALIEDYLSLNRDVDRSTQEIEIISNDTVNITRISQEASISAATNQGRVAAIARQVRNINDALKGLQDAITALEDEFGDNARLDSVINSVRAKVVTLAKQQPAQISAYVSMRV